jgi:hypothetical protein
MIEQQLRGFDRAHRASADERFARGALVAEVIELAEDRIVERLGEVFEILGLGVEDEIANDLRAKPDWGKDERWVGMAAQQTNTARRDKTSESTLITAATEES